MATTAVDGARVQRDTARMGLYDDKLTLREARRLYFDSNGFGEGGYEEKWVKVMVGPIPLRFPNSPQRVRSVRLHDLHHVVTDYATDWTGEAEIGAWEIASGCRDHYAAWLLNLFAFAIGLAIAPAAMWRAFVRGRRSANLYESDFREAMLQERVGELRSRLGLGPPSGGGRPADVLAFMGWSTVALATSISVACLLLTPAFLLVGLLA